MVEVQEIEGVVSGNDYDKFWIYQCVVIVIAICS